MIPAVVVVERNINIVAESNKKHPPGCFFCHTTVTLQSHKEAISGNLPEELICRINPTPCKSSGLQGFLFCRAAAAPHGKSGEIRGKFPFFPTIICKKGKFIFTFVVTDTY
jgi:hypothetical protein